jgi:hypothetical protein
MLISHELETRILNINYLLKQLDVTEAQRGQLLRLLGNAESELLEVYASGSLWETSLQPKGDATHTMGNRDQT